MDKKIDEQFSAKPLQPWKPKSKITSTVSTTLVQDVIKINLLRSYLLATNAGSSKEDGRLFDISADLLEKKAIYSKDDTKETKLIRKKLGKVLTDMKKPL